MVTSKRGLKISSWSSLERGHGTDTARRSRTIADTVQEVLEGEVFESRLLFVYVVHARDLHQPPVVVCASQWHKHTHEKDDISTSLYQRERERREREERERKPL
jgi:hypothetical protein